jgi:hypothetical protein
MIRGLLNVQNKFSEPVFIDQLSNTQISDGSNGEYTICNQTMLNSAIMEIITSGELMENY